MDGVVYIDGQYLAPQNATISVFDRGFLYGDSIYETMRVYAKRPFALKSHIKRLRASGRLVSFSVPFTDAFIVETIRKTIDSSKLEDARVRVVVTRGEGAFGLAPDLANDPKLIVMVLPLPPLPPSIYENGITTCFVGVHRPLTGTPSPQAKTGNYMTSIMALSEAREQGADDALMLSPSGHIAEASTANVFAFIAGQWHTPPLDVGILGGITRQTILQICQNESIAACEKRLSKEELLNADEIFLCSSIREIVPVVKLEGCAVGDGLVGSRTKELRKHYQHFVSASLGT